jgi:hypothetical protein
MISIVVIAVLCIIVIVWCIVWPGRSEDEQIAPSILKMLATVGLVTDGIAELVLIVARHWR